MTYNKSIKAKLYNYFTTRLNLKSSTNGYLRGDCPYCGSKNTFGIHIEKLRTNCFKSCGVPQPLGLLMYIEGFSTYTEARQFLNIQQEYEAYDRVFKVQKVERQKLELPEGYTLISLGKGKLANAARHSMEKRGFKSSALSKLGVGYTLEGEYAGYIIFPFYREGSRLEFFQGRLFAGSGPKMKNPPEEIYGVGKSQLIYNRDAMYMYNKVYIVESITNALTLGDRAIALLGKKASTYQISEILKSPCEELVIILDPDARLDAIHLCMKLCPYKRIKLVYWGEPIDDGPDINDLGKAETLRRVKLAEYVNYNKLLKLKNETAK